MDIGHLRPPAKLLAIAYRAVTNVAILTTPEKLLMVVITLVHSGSKDFESFSLARDVVVLGMKFLQDPTDDTKPHGQKIT